MDSPKIVGIRRPDLSVSEYNLIQSHKIILRPTNWVNLNYNEVISNPVWAARRQETNDKSDKQFCKFKFSSFSFPNQRI